MITFKEYFEEATKNINDPSGRSFKKGSAAEAEFANILQHNYPNEWRIAKPNEERIKHMDFVVRLDNRNIGIEVKSNKDNIMKGWMLVELKGVSGMPGWVYGGSKLLAYERPQGFVVYKMEDVRSYVEDTISNERVDNAYEAQYKLYARPSTRELVTFIELEDLDSTIKSQYFKKVA